MEDNAYAALAGAIRDEITGSLPVTFRIGTVMSGEPLTVEVCGLVYERNAFVFTMPLPGHEVEVEDTRLQYNSLSAEVSHSLEIDPHEHPGKTESHTHEADSEIGDTTLQYGVQAASLSYRYDIQPHKHEGAEESHAHTARIKNSLPVYEPGEKLLLFPIEDEQRYIILARVYGI